MRTEEIKLKINQLGLSEKLLLVEDIWDTIANNNSRSIVSAVQRQSFHHGKFKHKLVSISGLVMSTHL